jgi:SAM-dependent methyltransferase
MIASLAALMICPRCRRDALESNGTIQCGACGANIPVSGMNIIVDPDPDAGSTDWLEKQQESIARYENPEYDADPLAVATARLFGGFMAVTLDRDSRVMDIGCGINPGWPNYTAELGLKHIYGLEPIATPVDRPFPCLVGAMAESIPLKDSSLDAVMFATSMDHIADIDSAIAQIRRVVRPGGRLYIWTAVNEPEMLAWSKSFHNITHHGSLAKRIVRSAAIPAEYGLLLWRMFDRSRRLKAGRRLDPYHERWYTRQSMRESLDRWGTPLQRELLAPGSNSLFVEALNP